MAAGSSPSYVRPPDVPWEVLHFRPELREARDLSAWTLGVNVLRSTDGGAPCSPAGRWSLPAPYA